LYRRLGGPQSRSGRGNEEKNCNRHSKFGTELNFGRFQLNI